VDALLNWLWQGAVVAIAAAGILRLLDRARAAVRCFVCWAALLVVVALPVAPLLSAALAPAGRSAVSATAIVTVPVVWWTSGLVIAGALALWMAVYAIRVARAVVVVRRARARVRAFPPSVEQSLPHWRRIRATGRSVRLVLSERVRAAAVLGCGTPVIAVSPALVARLDADELDRVIVHEWAHVQRRDDVANIGQLVIRALTGWHPAVWWLDRRLSIEQELACDEIVVAESGGARSFASCLIKLASLPAAQRDALLASGALSSAGLARRVTRLVARSEFASATWSRGAAALLVVLLVAIAVGIAPVRIVEAAVAATSATVGRVLHPAATAAVVPADTRTEAAPRSGTAQGAVRRPMTASARPLLTASDASAAAVVFADQATSPTTEARVDEPLPAVTADTGTAHRSEPVSAPLETSPAPEPTAPPPPPAGDSRSAWAPAADAGVAVARGSKIAGVATAGAFTRLAKKIAGSF
jgi:beta-lactamase regulating signal transducer with metallopeptidase domain